MRKPSLSSFVLVSAMSLLASISNMTIGPIMSVYARDYINMTVAEIGLIASIFPIVSLLSKPIVGFYCRGSRILKIICLSFALITFPPFVMTVIKLPVIFGGLRIVQGIGNSMFWAPAMTFIVLISTKERRDRDISNYSFVISAGMSLGPAIGSISVATLGMTNTFIIASIIALIGFFLGVLLTKHGETYTGKLNDSDDRGFSIKELPRIFSGEPFRTSFSAYISVSFIYGILTVFATLYFKDAFRGLDEEVALLFFGYHLVLMASRFSLRRLLPITSKKNILLLSLVNYAVMLSIIVVSNNYNLFVGAFCLLGISHGFIYPTGVLTIAEASKRQDLALTNSVYLMGWDLGNALAPLISAPFVAIYSTRAALLISLISSITTLLITLISIKKK